MAAPYLDFIEALRRRECARHLFLDMGHPDGAVRAWSGVGNFSFLGATYIGVYGFGSVEGISYTSDLQNDSVKVSLNIAGLDLQSRAALNFPYQTATLYAAWIREDGSIAYYRPIIQGRTDASNIKLSESERQLIIPIRGFVADFSQAPRNYWSNQDQLKLYSNDTGLKYMSSFESSMLSGWGPTAPSSGGNMHISTAFRQYPGGGFSTLAADGPRCIGDHTNGVGFYRVSALQTSYNNTKYVEQTTGADTQTSFISSGLYQVNVGGNPVSIDVSGDIQTAGGKYVILSGGTTANRLRLISELAALGTPTAETIDTHLETFGAATLTYFKRNGVAYSAGNNQTTKIIDNYDGAHCHWDGTNVINGNRTFLAGSTVRYVEDTTGTPASIGGGKLRVGGANCVLSDNGTVLSPGGNKLIIEGGDPSYEFLRVWG